MSKLDAIKAVRPQENQLFDGTFHSGPLSLRSVRARQASGIHRRCGGSLMTGTDKAAAIREKAERLAGRSLGENGTR